MSNNHHQYIEDVSKYIKTCLNGMAIKFIPTDIQTIYLRESLEKFRDNEEFKVGVKIP
ncbi:TPA: hypothetical protein ACRZEE_004405 [Escherichia coli]|nr:hypothetical protein [Escherichia coli]